MKRPRKTKQILESDVALHDICLNYEPNKKRPTGEWSEIRRKDYECKNFEYFNRHNRKKKARDSCVNCFNLQSPDGSYRNRPTKIELRIMQGFGKE